jgi:hypothetical protein
MVQTQEQTSLWGLVVVEPEAVAVVGLAVTREAPVEPVEVE